MQKGIVEKSSGTNSKDESNSTVIKLANAGSSDNNKTKTTLNNSLVPEDPSTNINQINGTSALVIKKKPAKDYKRTIFISKLLQQQIITNNLAGGKFGNKDIETDKTSLLKGYDTLYAERSSFIKRDSVNPVILPRSPALTKVIKGIENKNFLVESTKTKSGKPSAFSVNLFFSPDFASYRLRDNVSGNKINEATEIEKDERQEFSSTIGALIEYKAKKHLSVLSGLTFSNTNITIAPKTIYARVDNSGSIKYLLNTSSGYGYVLPSFRTNPNVGDSLYAFTSTHTLKYLSLPVALKYNITNGRFTFNTMLGVAVNFLIKGKVETSVADGANNERESVNNLQGLKKVYFSGLTGVGIDYRLNKKLSITFAPAYRFALNSINKDAPVRSYPNSIGLTAGILFNF